MEEMSLNSYAEAALRDSIFYLSWAFFIEIDSRDVRGINLAEILLDINFTFN